LETAVLFLFLAVSPAVYCWLGALGAWSGKESDRNGRLVYFFISDSFTALAAGPWYVTAFVVSPFG
jgi:hypothetical protein